MSTAALDAWGWRIPFLLGLVVGIAGYVLRRYVLETATVEKRTRAPIVETLHEHWRVNCPLFRPAPGIADKA
jgi:MHS family proline/betaine transporter-like MFS transporter